MFMPIFKAPPLLIAALSVLSLSACSLFDDGFDDETNAEVEAVEETVAEWQEAEPDNLIECALAGAEVFARECLVERTERSWQTVLVVHHPDGGFRRFDVMDEGTAPRLETSDGADQALIEANGDQMQVTVASDIYLFPSDLTAIASE